MNAPCAGEKFGHSFAYTGASCSLCGVSQSELSGNIRRAEPVRTSNAFARFQTPKPKARGIHSETHALVDEVRKYFGETAKKGPGSFGYYLGYFMRMGAGRARQIFVESKEAMNPKKSFWWKVGEMRRVQKGEAPRSGYPQPGVDNQS